MIIVIFFRELELMSLDDKRSNILRLDDITKIEDDGVELRLFSELTYHPIKKISIAHYQVV